MESQKSCPQGQYYCYTDKKCKKIPTGYHMGRGGYLAKDNADSSDDSKNGKNGNGNGNGNGHSGNGNGGGNGGGCCSTCSKYRSRRCACTFSMR